MDDDDDDDNDSWLFLLLLLLLLLLFLFIVIIVVFSLSPLFLGWVCKVYANRQKSKPVKQGTFTIRYSDILKFKHLCCHHGAWATTKTTK